MKLLNIPQSKKIILEIDDITTDRWRESRKYVYELKKIYPQLKITLWNIPGLCDFRVKGEIYEKDWIEWGLHGEFHWRQKDGDVLKVGGECDQWNFDDTERFISRYYSSFPTKINFNNGFKAPWYYIKGKALKAFKNNDWFVAIHHKYTQGIPKGLRVYDYTKYEGSLRLHIQDSHFDGIRENFDRLSKAFDGETKFEFVSENIEKYKGDK